MDVFSMLIDMVKSNGAITQLQQDIVETIRELEKQQFDKFSVENRIIKNSENHQDLFNAYGLLPLAMQNINQFEIVELYRYYLYSQLGIMMARELEEHSRG